MHTQPQFVDVLHTPLAKAVIQLHRHRQRLQVRGNGQADMHSAGLHVQVDRAGPDDTLRMHRAIGQDADRFSFEVFQAADMGDRLPG